MNKSGDTSPKAGPRAASGSEPPCTPTRTPSRTPRFRGEIYRISSPYAARIPDDDFGALLASCPWLKGHS